MGREGKEAEAADLRAAGQEPRWDAGQSAVSGAGERLSSAGRGVAELEGV